MDYTIAWFEGPKHQTETKTISCARRYSVSHHIKVSKHSWVSWWSSRAWGIGCSGTWLFAMAKGVVLWSTIHFTYSLFLTMDCICFLSVSVLKTCSIHVNKTTAGMILEIGFPWYTLSLSLSLSPSLPPPLPHFSHFNQSIVFNSLNEVCM